MRLPQVRNVVCKGKTRRIITIIRRSRDNRTKPIHTLRWLCIHTEPMSKIWNLFHFSSGSLDANQYHNCDFSFISTCHPIFPSHRMGGRDYRTRFKNTLIFFLSKNSTRFERVECYCPTWKHLTHNTSVFDCLGRHHSNVDW